MQMGSQLCMLMWENCQVEQAGVVHVTRQGSFFRRTSHVFGATTSPLRDDAFGRDAGMVLQSSN